MWTAYVKYEEFNHCFHNHNLIEYAAIAYHPITLLQDPLLITRDVVTP